MERRYQSPYKHWIRGFVFEIAVFWAFMALVALVAVLVSWAMG